MLVIPLSKILRLDRVGDHKGHFFFVFPPVRGRESVVEALKTLYVVKKGGVDRNNNPLSTNSGLRRSNSQV